jgi:membrane protease YdiL (CAAX protease family)
MVFIDTVRTLPRGLSRTRLDRQRLRKASGIALPIVVASTGVVFARLPGIFFSWAIDAMLFFFLPSILVLVVTRSDLRKHGLGLGNKTLGVIAAVVGMALSVVVVGVGASLSPGVQTYYGNRTINLDLVVSVATYMFAWEFLLRGYVLTVLEPKIGIHKANAVQSVIFFFAHSAKPPLEFYSTAITGPLFGYISHRTQSVYSMVLIHTVIYLSVVYFTM